MPRPFKFPNPKDRTINSPAVVARPAHILGNFNQGLPPDEKRSKIDGVVKDWFVRTAIDLGWSTATFDGDCCCLIASLVLRTQANTKEKGKSDV
jgi:hypothetical protein